MQLDSFVITLSELRGIDAASNDFVNGAKSLHVKLSRDDTGRLHVRFDAGYGSLDYWVNSDGTFEHHAHL